jgi:hypothetical protein
MPIVSIDIEARLAQFQDSLKAIERQTQQTADRIGKAFSGVKGVLATLGVGVSAGAFVSLIKGAIDAQDHINDLSKTTGVSVERLSGLSLAARQSGSDLESIALSVNKLSQNIGTSGDKFKALGITAKDPLEAFEQLADIFVSLQDDQLRAGVAAGALGKQWQGAAPLLAEGGKRIKELVEEGQKLSGVTKKNAEEADKFNDQLALLKTQSGKLALDLANPLLPSLNNIVQAFINGTREAGLFGGALQALRAGTSDVIEGIAKNVQGIRLGVVTSQIEDLQKQLDSGHVNSSVLKFLGFDPKLTADQIVGIKNSIKDLRTEQAGLLQTLNPQKADASIDISQSKEAKARAAEEEARKKKAQADAEAKAKRFLDFEKNQAEEKALREAKLKLAESTNKIEFDKQKQAAADELSILEKRHSDNLVSEQEYWDSRAKIRQAGLAAELGAVDKTIAARQKFIASPPPGTKGADTVNAQRELGEAKAQREKLLAANSQEEKIATLEQTEAEKKYSDQIRESVASIHELQGQTALAAQERFDLSNQGRIDQANVNHDENLKKLINDQRSLTVAQAEYNQLQTELDAIYTRLSVQEERIQNDLRQHAISEIEALQRTSEARRKAVEEAAGIVNRIGQVSQGEGGTDQLRVKAEQAKVALETLGTQTDLVGEKIRTTLTDDFATVFEDLINHTKSFKDTFLDFLTTIENQITKLVAQELGQKLFKSLMPQGDSKGGPGGGLIDTFFKFFGIGGGSSTPGPPLPSTGGSDFSFDSIVSMLPKFAAGTDYVPFDMIAQIHKGEKIVPAAQNKGGGSMPGVTNVFNFSSPPDSRSISQVSSAAYSGAQRAWRRNR